MQNRITSSPFFNRPTPSASTPTIRWITSVSWLTPRGVNQLTEVIRRMVGVLAEGVGRLKKGDDVMRFCIEAKKLEEEGDALYHEALGHMFETERDALEVIKWKEIYDNLERTLDESEDVANDLESITIKHA